MFQNASAFDQSLDTWDVGNVTTMEGMLIGSEGFSLQSYDQSLIGWLAHGVQSNVPLDAPSVAYCQAITVHQTLTADYNWVIIDAGEKCEVPTIDTSTPDGTYGVGTVIALKLTFATPVYVTGAPQLNLRDGLTAQYTGGSGTAVLTFTYTVSPGDNTTDLDWSYVSPDFLSLNGGSIKYQNIQDLSLDSARWPLGGGLTLGSNHNIRINTVIQTDFGLAITAPGPSPIQSGATVSSHITITNYGPYNSFFGGGLYYFMPAGFTYVSNTNTSQVGCQYIGTGSDFDDPYFNDLYPNNGLIACVAADDSIPLAVDQSIEFDITLTATITTAEGAIFGGYYLDDANESDSLQQFENAYAMHQDLTLLPINNAARATYHTPSVPPPTQPTTSYACTRLVALADTSNALRTAPLDVSFTAKGQVSNTNIQSYLFDFGDGSSIESSAPAANHRYIKNGTYKATARIKTSQGTTTVANTCAVTVSISSVPRAPTSSQNTNLDKSNIPTPKNLYRQTRDRATTKKSSSGSDMLRKPGADYYLFISLLLLLALAYVLQAWREYRFTRDAQQAIAKAKQRASMTQQFLEIITHYLNTPLAVLQGAHELMTSKHTLDSIFLANFGQKLIALRSTVQGFEGSVEASLAQGGQSSFADSDQKLLTKARTMWASLLGIALAIAAIDLTLLLTGAYEKRGARLVNLILLAIFSALLIGIYYVYHKRSKVLHADIDRELANVQMVTKQKEELLQSVAPALQHHTDQLSQGTEGMAQLPDAHLLVNGLTMLHKLTQELTSYQRLTQINPAASVDAASYYKQSIEPAVQRLAQEKGSTLQSNVADGLLVPLQSDQLDYILSAVIGNAIEYSPAGSKAVVGAQSQRNKVSIKVSDNGPGLSPEVLNGLFEPLQRGTDTQTFDHQGLGLSMFVAKHVIEQSGGTISIDSEVGAGTSVKISLPRLKGEVGGQNSYIIKPTTGLD